MKAKQTLLSRRCIQKMECRICLKFFTSLDHLREHMKDSHQPQQFDDLPKYCKFLSFYSRLHSFISSHSIPPHRLSLSGFYYTEEGDCVQCFWCGLQLRYWQRNDDPWYEHQKYNPSCYYFRTCSPYMGIDEVDSSWV